MNPLTRRHYIGVCGLLIALTFVTVGVSFLPMPSPWHVFLGLLIATAKASLVLLIFMHLYVSKPLTWLVVIVTACWLILLFGLTLSDFVSRGLVPTMPGH
jgi:cytochrome c oxidase subunit 4